MMEKDNGKMTVTELMDRLILNALSHVLEYKERMYGSCSLVYDYLEENELIEEATLDSPRLPKKAFILTTRGLSLFSLLWER